MSTTSRMTSTCQGRRKHIGRGRCIAVFDAVPSAWEEEKSAFLDIIHINTTIYQDYGGSDNEFDKDVDSPDPVEQPEGHQEECKQESDKASEKVDSGQRSSWTSVGIKEGENLAECISNCMSYL